jgi:hypothetical protein
MGGNIMTERKTRTRYAPATAERYMKGVELELAGIEREAISTGGEGIEMAVLEVNAKVKAQLAQVAATLRLAEAQETTNSILSQIGELLTMHPAIRYGMQVGGLLADLNGKIEEKDGEINSLRMALNEAQKETPNGAKQN